MRETVTERREDAKAEAEHDTNHDLLQRGGPGLIIFSCTADTDRKSNIETTDLLFLLCVTVDLLI